MAGSGPRAAPTPAPCSRSGASTKPHGLRGEVVVELTTDRVERLAPGTVLGTDGDDLVVASSRPHQDRWIVAFDGVDGREAADAAPRAPRCCADAARRPRRAVGARAGRLEVVETVGGEPVRHRASSVVANPASDLLVLDSARSCRCASSSTATRAGSRSTRPTGLFDL